MKKCCMALEDRSGLLGTEKRDEEWKCQLLEITAMCRACLFGGTATCLETWWFLASRIGDCAYKGEEMSFSKVLVARLGAVQSRISAHLLSHAAVFQVVIISVCRHL